MWQGWRNVLKKKTVEGPRKNTIEGGRVMGTLCRIRKGRSVIMGVRIGLGSSITLSTQVMPQKHGLDMKYKVESGG